MTLCWVSGTVPAMLHWAISLKTPHQEAKRRCFGCVPIAQQGKSTAIQQHQITEPGDGRQAVPFALV